MMRTRLGAQIVVALLGLVDLLPRREPFDRKLERGIGESRAGRTFLRALPVLVVRLPCDPRDPVHLGGSHLEFGVVEARLEAGAERGFVQLEVLISVHDSRRGGIRRIVLVAHRHPP
jgi:hypothetical protein